MSSNYLESKIRRFYSVLFTLLLIVVISSAVFCFYNILFKVKIKNAQETLDQFAKNVNAYMGSYSNLTDSISDNSELQEYLELDNENRINSTLFSVAESLNNISMSFDGIINLAILDGAGAPIYTKSNYPMRKNQDVAQLDWYQKALRSRGQVNFSASHKNELFENPSEVITLSKCILSPTSHLQIGMVMMDIRTGYISSMSRGINYGNINPPFITNHAGQFIYQPKNNHPAIDDISAVYTMDGSKFTLATNSGTYVIVKNSERSLYAFCLLPGRFLLSDLPSYMVALCVIVMITILIVIISRRFSRKITEPLMQLTNAAQEVRNGNLDVDFRLESTVEITSLSASLYDMLSKLKASMKKIQDHERQLRINELRLLQAQINPHFLYNTLDTIISIAECDGNRNVVNITLALSEYFKIILSSGSEVIPIQNEIQHIRSYLFIQQTRYEHLQTAIDVDKSIMSIKIPKLLLQPLVENAIYHGIKPKGGVGLIEIKGYISNGSVILRVTDNGNGMRPKELDRVISGRISPPTNNNPSSGVGINNIRERLRLYYGGNAALTITSVFKQYTSIEISIPADYTLADQTSSI